MKQPINFAKMTNAEYLAANRDNIIMKINNEIRRVNNVFGKAKSDLKCAMTIYKEVLEQTNNAGKAETAAFEAISGKMKVSKYFFLSDSAKNQLPSSMR